MIPRRRLGLAGLLLVLWAGALEAQSPDLNKPCSVKSESFPEARTKLLLQSKYRIRDDGSVLAADGQPVSCDDLMFILQRLESGQRLKALLQINIILVRSEGEREKDLTPQEREAIRGVVKENWALFNLRTRKNFRGYFSLQELELMDQVPLPRALLDEPPLPDQDVAEEPAAPAAPVAAVAPPPPPPPAPAPAAAAPFAPVAARAVPIPSVAAPTPAPAPALTAPAAPAAAPAPVAAVPAPAAAAPAPAAAAALPAAAAAVVIATSAPAPAPSVPALPLPTRAELAAAAPAAPVEPPLVEVTPAAFEAFLVQAPYGREVKDLLRLISENAPYARNRVLNDVMSVMPQIVIDADRTGARLYSRLEQAPGMPPSIALNSGVVMTERSRLFFGATTTYLPRSAKAFAEAGLPAPALQALRPDAVPQLQLKGPWGDTAHYEDGSLRASFSPEAQAGALLAELMRLDSRLRGWDASAVVVEKAARTAQWLFYGNLAAARGGDAFLDPLLRASYREWLDFPAAYHDGLLLSLSASRSGVVDQRKADLAAVAEFDRRALADCVAASAAESEVLEAAARQARSQELAAYQATGLFKSDALAAAREAAGKKPAGAAAKSLCRPEWSAEMAALAKSGVVLAESVEAEKRMRQGRESHEQ